MYLGIKGKVLVQKGDLEEAVSVLEAGLALPGVKAPARGVPPVPLADRAAIFVQVRRSTLHICRMASPGTWVARSSFVHAIAWFLLLGSWLTGDFCAWNGCAAVVSWRRC